MEDEDYSGSGWDVFWVAFTILLILGLIIF